MSSFFAVVHFDKTPIHREALGQMLRRIAYRGPDYQALKLSPSDTVAVGASLFRVVNESRQETQPLIWDGGMLAGRVFLTERDHLVRELRTAGGRAAEGLEHTDSLPDSHLVLRSYLAWGTGCVAHLHGNFSFVIWDSARCQAFAARDEFGVNNLYYAYLNDPEAGRVLVISPEITAIRLYPLVPSTLDDQAVGDFLTLGSSIGLDKTQTIFSAIRAVAPAHALSADPEGVKTWRYWELPRQYSMIRYRTERDYVEAYRVLLETLVRDRMRGNRILVSMSGGMDSTSLAAIASRLQQAGVVNTEVRAITATYTHQMNYEEGHYARMVAAKLNIPIDVLPMDDYGLMNPLPRRAQPQPGYMGNGYETGKWLTERSRVVFYGTGPDEMFAFSPLAVVMRGLPLGQALSLYAWLWRFLKHRPGFGGVRSFFKPRRSVVYQDTMYPSWIDPDFAREFDLRDRFVRYWGEDIDTHGMVQPWAYRIISTLLVSGEAETQESLSYTPAISLTPYVDRRFVEFALALPPLPFNTHKYLMRQAMKGILPDEILERRKAPLGPLLRILLSSQENLEWVDNWEPEPAIERYIVRSKVPRLVKVDLTGVYAGVQMRALAFNQWLQHYQVTLERERQGQYALEPSALMAHTWANG